MIELFLLSCACLALSMAMIILFCAFMHIIKLMWEEFFKSSN